MYPTKIALLMFLLIVWTTARGDFESATAAYQNRDYSAAYAGFLPLAEAGDPRAQTIIALMHRYGESVQPDLGLAFSWYRQAAESGYAPAQYSIGEMYADGQGVAPDRQAAILWLSKAAVQGFKRASTRLESLSADPLDIPPETNPAERPAIRKPSIPWNFRLPNAIRNDSGDLTSEDLTDLQSEAYLVQVGAIGTQAGANRLWEWFTVQAPGLFEDRDPIVELSEAPDRRIYMVAVGPFDDLQQATTFCERLRQSIREAGCLPLKQH